jgi:hypothetical protein
MLRKQSGKQGRFSKGRSQCRNWEGDLWGGGEVRKRNKKFGGGEVLKEMNISIIPLKNLGQHRKFNNVIILQNFMQNWKS